MTRETDNETFVRRVQRWLGVSPDGWAGQNTLEAFNKRVGLEIPEPAAWPDPVLIAALKKDEGLRLTAYKDTVGVWTVGYGHAHVPPGTVWTADQAEAALIEDVKKHNDELERKIPWINNLDPVRRRVLQNMAFNLGIGNAANGTGLLGFKNTLEYVRTGQYAKAADGMRASKWARQVKGRAVRLAREMETGLA